MRFRAESDQSLLNGGVYAALLTARRENGEPDIEAFSGLIRFLRGKGVDGVVVNGATGEYSRNSLGQTKALFRACAEVAGGLPFICGIGAATVQETVELGQAAGELGAAAVLLPNPYFYPLGQEDVIAFCRHMVEHVEAPVLLYHIPQFTTGFDVASVRELAGSVAGLKDSSGSLEIFRDIFRDLDVPGFQKVVGSLCDAVISGVSGVLPELICFLVRSHGAVRSAGYAQAERFLMEFIEQISRFPTPWGLKLAAECRGISRASFPVPLSARREKAAREFREWFDGWWPMARTILSRD
jgi:4-hydroxy-tetrahydrodipicolinate synthase